LEVNDSKVSFEKEILLYWQLDIPEAKKADYRPTPNASSQHHVDVTTPMRLAYSHCPTLLLFTTQKRQF
jgi:hypothetical protein